MFSFCDLPTNFATSTTTTEKKTRKIGYGQDFFRDMGPDWRDEFHILGVSSFLSHEWHLTTDHHIGQPSHSFNSDLSELAMDANLPQFYPSPQKMAQCP